MAGSKAVLTYGPVWRWALAACVVCFAALTAGALVAARPPARGILATVGLLLTALCGMGLLDLVRGRIEVDRVGVSLFSAWMKPRSVSWSELARVEYSAARRCILLMANGKKAVPVPEYLDGLHSLGAYIVEHVPGIQLDAATRRLLNV